MRRLLAVILGLVAAEFPAHAAHTWVTGDLLRPIRSTAICSWDTAARLDYYDQASKIQQAVKNGYCVVVFGPGPNMSVFRNPNNPGYRFRFVQDYDRDLAVVLVIASGNYVRPDTVTVGFAKKADFALSRE